MPTDKYDELLKNIQTLLLRTKYNRHNKSVILLGHDNSEMNKIINLIGTSIKDNGLYEVNASTNNNGIFPSIAASFKSILEENGATDHFASSAMSALYVFLKTLKSKGKNVECPLDNCEQEETSESFGIEHDFLSLIDKVGTVLKQHSTGAVLIVKDIHRCSDDDLSILVAAVHKISIDQMPFLIIASGKPKTVRALGKIKPYSERLFEFVNIA